MGAKTMKGRRSPITETTARGKMSPQEAVGYGNWPDEEAKKMGLRPRRCVIVSLSELEDSVKLRALEERMWIWNEPELNSMMSLYDKPYIIS